MKHAFGVIVAGLVISASAGSADAQVQGSVGWDQYGLDHLHVAVGDVYGAPVGHVPSYIYPDELPVVYLLAREARVSPEIVMALREQGWSWLDISYHLGVDPYAFVHHLPYDDGYWGWRRGRDYRYLTDRHIIDYVNLAFWATYHRRPVTQIIVIRQRIPTWNYYVVYHAPRIVYRPAPARYDRPTARRGDRQDQPERRAQPRERTPERNAAAVRPPVRTADRATLPSRPADRAARPADERTRPVAQQPPRPAEQANRPTTRLPTRTPERVTQPSTPSRPPAQATRPSTPSRPPAQATRPSTPSRPPAQATRPSAPSQPPAQVTRPAAPSRPPAQATRPSAPSRTPAQATRPSTPNRAPAQATRPSTPASRPAAQRPARSNDRESATSSSRDSRSSSAAVNRGSNRRGG
jgi:hypothetical protein